MGGEQELLASLAAKGAIAYVEGSWSTNSQYCGRRNAALFASVGMQLQGGPYDIGEKYVH
jgi:hypothetical protein